MFGFDDFNTLANRRKPEEIQSGASFNSCKTFDQLPVARPDPEEELSRFLCSSRTTAIGNRGYCIYKSKRFFKIFGNVPRRTQDARSPLWSRPPLCGGTENRYHPVARSFHEKRESASDADIGRSRNKTSMTCIEERGSARPSNDIRYINVCMSGRK